MRKNYFYSTEIFNYGLLFTFKFMNRLCYLIYSYVHINGDIFAAISFVKIKNDLKCLSNQQRHQSQY